MGVTSDFHSEPLGDANRDRRVPMSRGNWGALTWGGPGGGMLEPAPTRGPEPSGRGAGPGQAAGQADRQADRPVKSYEILTGPTRPRSLSD